MPPAATPSSPRLRMSHDHRHDGAHDGRGGACGGHGHLHHRHGLPPGGFDRAMALAIGLNTAFVVIEIAAGVVGGSLALIADAGHNAGDVVGLLLAWGAARLARRPPTARYTWGLRRATIWAALANALLLFVACGGILREALLRFGTPVPVAGPTMIAVAAIGVAINGFTALLFMRGARGDANVRGAFLHMAADAAVSAGVVVAGIAIALTGRTWIDPVVGVVITATILVGTWDLFREGLEMGLDAVPRAIDPAAVAAALGGLPGVTEVHDLHVWNASTSEVSLSVHLVVPDAARHGGVLADAGARLRADFGIAHTTIQIEDAASAERCPQRPADTL